WLVLVPGPYPLKLNSAATVYVPAGHGLSTYVSYLPPTRESIAGVQARDDPKSYRVWHKTDEVGGPAGKYLVDEGGRAMWRVDPGINGTAGRRPDGTAVRKFDAPKAPLRAYIIRCLLDHPLRWGVVPFRV